MRGVVPPNQQSSLPDKELGAPPRHEHPGCHGNPEAAELGPAEDLLKRQADVALADHGFEFGWCAGRRHQQPGLVLGEDTTCGAEPTGDMCV